MAENKHSSIDDVVNHASASNKPAADGNTIRGQDNLEHKVQDKKDDGGWNFKQIAKDVIKFSPFTVFNFMASGGLAYMTGGISWLAASSSLLSPIGYGIGRIIENKKQKKKTTWYEMRKELGTGNFVGNLAYWLYQIPEFLNISTATWGGKLLRALAFNPGMLLPFVAVYQPIVYLRDKIGTRKALMGLLNGKIFGYLKEAYNKDMKKEYWPTVRKTFLTLYPIHVFSLNYVKTPALRVGIGAANDVIFLSV